MVDKLTALSTQYRQQGNEFFAHADADRHRLYFGQQGQPGLYTTFLDIKKVSGDIRQINQDNMEQANTDAKRLGRSALLWYSGALALGIALAVFLTASTIHTILDPIRAVTDSAAAIGAGDLDQLVPIACDDELGQLAGAFNAMARQLARLSPLAQGAVDSGPADQPGHDQFLPRSGSGGRSGSSTWNWPTRWPAGCWPRCRRRKASALRWSGNLPSRCGNRWPKCC